MSENTKMPITAKGLRLLLMGLLVMVAGFVLMIPDKFNWAMFDFRRLVAAPLVIIVGVVIEIVAIMRRPKESENNKVE